MKNTTKRAQEYDNSPLPGRRDLVPQRQRKGTEGDLGGGPRSGYGMVTGDSKGLAGRQADNTGEVLAEDGHPGGGRRTESRMETGGARRIEQREEPGRRQEGTWIRRSQAGPGPQP